MPKAQSEPVVEDNVSEPEKSQQVKVFNELLKKRSLYLDDGSIGEFNADGILLTQAHLVQNILKVPGFSLVD